MTNTTITKPNDEVKRSKNVLLDIKNLSKHYPIKGGILGKTVNFVSAVDNVSFQVYEGEVLGIVGESGCGKSTTGRTVLRLEEPTDGEIWFEGKEITHIPGKALRDIRKKMQIIFQDPFASLNPRKTIRQTLREPLDIMNLHTIAEREKRVKAIMEEVGLAEQHLERLPHEFSGGQRQRIGIARALILQPKIIVADEAVSALDVSIQAQVINLLKRLQKDHQLTYMFISHDMGVIKHISDRIAVMYLGKIVELASKEDLFQSAKHPYTQALLSAVPTISKTGKRERIILEGDVPSPVNPPSGCRFHTRCWLADERCKKEVPILRNLGSGHQVACHHI